MHWVSGTWLWAKHKASRSTSSGAPIYFEQPKGTSERRNRPRTWSLPTNPPDDSSTASSRSRGSSYSQSHGYGHGHTHSVHRVETYSQAQYNNPMAVAQLRCIRCGGLRSREYHYRHFDDPVKYPSVGICSRQRTRCARAKSAAMDPPATAVAPVCDIPELPDTSTSRPKTASGEIDPDRYYGLSTNLMKIKSLG
ncbi:uncharacterized protein BDW70DRAFT_161702 [Aspergillus foveolatus]|uniref:uncharacterized protein n=1 Tax=Aspergillus foveolatus TaxID=210207 RepID=UPI003CCCCF65